MIFVKTVVRYLSIFDSHISLDLFFFSALFFISIHMNTTTKYWVFITLLFLIYFKKLYNNFISIFQLFITSVSKAL